MASPAHRLWQPSECGEPCPLGIQGGLLCLPWVLTELYWDACTFWSIAPTAAGFPGASLPLNAQGGILSLDGPSPRAMGCLV